MSHARTLQYPSLERPEEVQATSYAAPSRPETIRYRARITAIHLGGFQPAHRPWEVPGNVYIDTSAINKVASFKFSSTRSLDTAAITTADQIFCNGKILPLYPGMMTKPIAPMQMEVLKEEQSYYVWKPKEAATSRAPSSTSSSGGYEGFSRWLPMRDLVGGWSRRTKKKQGPNPQVLIHSFGLLGPKHRGGWRKIDRLFFVGGLLVWLIIIYIHVLA